MSTNDVIVIGASSGGIEALKSLVSGFSPDLPAAVFVVLHIGAQPSILPDILRQTGTLPVEHGIDKAAIENGRIYVAPPDHHLMLSPGHIHITKGPKENNARPSINTLFRTAASAYGKRVTGTVLTGALNDGSDTPKRPSAFRTRQSAKVIGFRGSLWLHVHSLLCTVSVGKLQK